MDEIQIIISIISIISIFSIISIQFKKKKNNFFKIRIIYIQNLASIPT